MRDVVGPEWIRTAVAERDTYASDGLPTHRSRPGVVVLPGSHDEVVRLMRIVAHHRIPFVARGAGTGLSGGALANEGSVLIVLTRLTRILHIDPVNRFAVVEPGVVNTRLTEATRPLGLHYAPDPSSQTVCTMGGNVAENAGGPHCLKYGVTSNHVLELLVVLPDGTVTTLGSPSGEPWGPDLVGLFVGSEGLFGIATRITVRLTPIPSVTRTLFADFASLRQAGEAVSAIIASGTVPAALEMMDRNCVHVVESSIYAAGYPTDADAVLLVELDGRYEPAVEAECVTVERILRAGGARTIRTAADPAERERLWHGRKKAFGALGRLDSALMVQDTVVPRSALPRVLERVEAIGAGLGIRIANVFHAGDGNLHPNITFDETDAAEAARVREASAAIIDACVAAGGTITGEHGVGVDKLQYMRLIFDPETLAALSAIRLAFDPQEIANPGKVLPSTSRAGRAGRDPARHTPPARIPQVEPTVQGGDR
ncbi:MAG: FAD-linked oxidase C-terminal domain-containing protein [Gemmatimonadales bacterium]|jgi:glycolate oxidase subunit GlcD